MHALYTCAALYADLDLPRQARYHLARLDPRVRQPRLIPRGAMPSPGLAKGHAGAGLAISGLF